MKEYLEISGKEFGKMLLFIGICCLVYQGLKAALDDAEMRNHAKSKGWDSYPSRTGMRDVKTNKHCYTDPRTGKKTLW